MNAVVQERPQVHLFFAGRSTDIYLDDLDVGVLSSDAQIREAVARFMEAPLAKFQQLRVERITETGHINLRPEAEFGC